MYSHICWVTSIASVDTLQSLEYIKYRFEQLHPELW